jgi:2-hydroxy-3-oxopropionate reductase
MSNDAVAPLAVGFIGLGNMGGPMALRLARAGVDLTVFDLAEEAVAVLVQAGATAASSVRDCVKDRQLVITMLPDTEVVTSIATGSDGFIEAMEPGSVLVDMSTGDPSFYAGLVQQAEPGRIAILDGPVSGGTTGAADGTLSIMVGGSVTDFREVVPTLSHLGKPMHVGDLGAGQTAKLCNQVMVALHIQAACEGLSLARAAGLDLETLSNVLHAGAAQSWILDNLGPKMISGDDSAGFRIDIQLKDLRIATRFAHSIQVPIPAAAAVANQ